MARNPKPKFANDANDDADAIGNNSGPADAIPNDGGDGNAEATGNATGSGSGGIDPDSLTGDDYARDANGNVKFNRDGSPAKKRGRKAGRKTGAGNSGANAASNKQNINGAVETLAMAIGGLHLAIAAFAKSPEMQLDDSESIALSKSIVNVMAQFDMSPDPRIVAIGGLIATSAQIYGPRLYLIRERQKNEKPIDVAPNSVSVSNPTGGSSGGIDISAFNFTGG